MGNEKPAFQRVEITLQVVTEWGRADWRLRISFHTFLTEGKYNTVVISTNGYKLQMRISTYVGRMFPNRKFPNTMGYLGHKLVQQDI